METIPAKKIIEDSFSKNEIINTVNDDPLPSEINPIELDDLVKKSIIKNKDDFHLNKTLKVSVKEMQAISLLSPKQLKVLNDRMTNKSLETITEESSINSKSEESMKLIENEFKVLEQKNEEAVTQEEQEETQEEQEAVTQEEQEETQEEQEEVVTREEQEEAVTQEEQEEEEVVTREEQEEAVTREEQEEAVTREEKNKTNISIVTTNVKIIEEKEKGKGKGKGQFKKYSNEHTINATNKKNMKKPIVKENAGSLNNHNKLSNLLEPPTVFSNSKLHKDNLIENTNIKENPKLEEISHHFVKAIKSYKVKIFNIINNKECELNKRVKQIYIINLVEDIRKRNYIITVMKKYGINYSLVVVDRVSSETHQHFCANTGLTRGELGTSMSHLWCLLQGIQKELDNIIIFEDDIIFHKDFINYFNHIYDNNKNIDFMLLGAHDFQFSKKNYKNIKNNLYKPDNDSQHLYGAHANYYSLKGMKRMFNIRVTQISFFDKEYMLMFNYLQNSYVVYPNMVVSDVSSSTLNHERPFFSEIEKAYYSKCFINFNFTNYNYLYIKLFDYINSLDEKGSYDNITEKYLYNAFHDFDKIEEIKKRMPMDFFTIDDIKNILTKH